MVAVPSGGCAVFDRKQLLRILCSALGRDDSRRSARLVPVLSTTVGCSKTTGRDRAGPVVSLAAVTLAPGVDCATRQALPPDAPDRMGYRLGGCSLGLLQDGQWVDRWYDTASTGGRFVRKDSQFRNWVTADGQPGPTGEGGFRAEPGRYHLYVSHACPWAHRVMIFRALKGLETMISVSVVHWHMAEHGWTFAPGPGVVPDTLHGSTYLHQVYTRADPRYSGRVTVPILWDTHRGTIVSNESSEIIRMLNSAFDGLGARPGDFYPQDLRPAIDTVNERIYRTVNNGVYKAGFATQQAPYEEAVSALFETLDWLEERLSRMRYLVGSRLTEADWRLFTTLLRFDPVYVGHFKCNLRRLVDYPNLWGHTRELAAVPGVAETIDMHHIRHHYYGSHKTLNPSGVVPLGPTWDLDTPHGRGAQAAAASSS